MFDIEYLQIACLVLFSICFAIAAFTDLADRKIPNTIPLFLIALWLVYAPLSGQNLLHSIAIGALILLLSILTFSKGWIGGGDGKLIAVGALWMGPALALPFILIMGVLGGVMALFWRFEPVMRFVLARAGLPISVVATRELPYGVAIAGSALLLVPSLLAL